MISSPEKALTYQAMPWVDDNAKLTGGKSEKHTANNV